MEPGFERFAIADNFLLGAVDHYALEQLRVGGWVRYMDDMVILGADKTTVRAQADAVVAFIADRLHQQERVEARRLAPVHTGLPFLGFRVWPQRLRLDASRKRRLARHLRLSDPIRLQSAVAWAEQGDTRGLRVSLLRAAPQRDM